MPYEKWHQQILGQCPSTRQISYTYLVKWRVHSPGNCAVHIAQTWGHINWLVGPFAWCSQIMNRKITKARLKSLWNYLNMKNTMEIITMIIVMMTTIMVLTKRDRYKYQTIPIMIILNMIIAEGRFQGGFMMIVMFVAKVMITIKTIMIDNGGASVSHLCEMDIREFGSIGMFSCGI